MVKKGLISSVEDDKKTAVVIPSDATSTVTFPLVVPYFLVGALKVSDAVAYVEFADNTGIVLSRMDGEWSHKITDSLKIECKTEIAADVVATGKVTASDVKTGTVASLNGHTHPFTHGGTSSSPDVTGGPQ